MTFTLASHFANKQKTKQKFLFYAQSSKAINGQNSGWSGHSWLHGPIDTGDFYDVGPLPKPHKHTHTSVLITDITTCSSETAQGRF